MIDGVHTTVNRDGRRGGGGGGGVHNKFWTLDLVGEPRPKFGKLQGRGAIKGLKADSYVKQPAG